MAVTKTVNFILTVVDAPGIGVTLNPAVGQVQRGQSIAVQISISSIGGYAGAVTFAVSDLPAGVTAVFAPASIVPGQSTTITISTLATTPTGNVTVAITATGA